MDSPTSWNWPQWLKWSQPIEFLQNTLTCSTPRSFRREWNQRSRENTDFAIVSKATGRGYKQWSHCHKHVLQVMVKNSSRLAQGSEIELDLDSATVENLLRILYTRQYVSVDSITKNHHLLMRFIHELGLVPDRLKVARNYLRSEFHRFASDQSFLSLTEAQMEPYINTETLPLHTVLDLNIIIRAFLRWASASKFSSHTNASFSSVDMSAFTRIASTLYDLLTEVHGQLTVNSIEVNRFASLLIESFYQSKEPSLENRSSLAHDLVLLSSDNVQLSCNRKLLCRIPYFNSLLHGGFRESLQHERVTVDIHSSILRLVLSTMTTGELPDLPVGRLLDTYTVFDYLQSDELLDAFDQQLRRTFFSFSQTCLDELLCEISPAILERILPALVQDMTNVFGMQGYAFLLHFILRWLEVDASRDDCLATILLTALDTVDQYEHARPVIYESFDGLVHVFNGKTWAPCHWGDFDSMREVIYNFKVFRYKQRYLTHNFLHSNGVSLRNCITCEETEVVRHGEGQTGYFVEMLGHVFCSVGGQHFVITDDLQLCPVDMPRLNGFALEPRCVDTVQRRVYFDTERVGYCVTLDEEFRVTGRSQFGSVGVTADHQLHVINGHVLALRLGHAAMVLDEKISKFVSVKEYLQVSRDVLRLTPLFDVLPDPRRLLGAALLPRIQGIIYRIFDLNEETFMIVTEAVELTQARLRISETESDPRVVGFFRWRPDDRFWEDVSASTRIPRSQIQQAIILNHPGLPIYSRRPCHA